MRMFNSISHVCMSMAFGGYHFSNMILTQTVWKHWDSYISYTPSVHSVHKAIGLLKQKS